jgi:hypothetical protein
MDRQLDILQRSYSPMYFTILLLGINGFHNCGVKDLPLVQKESDALLSTSVTKVLKHLQGANTAL